MESSAFREAISHFATGLTVVTTVHDGRPAGMTASAVCGGRVSRTGFVPVTRCLDQPGCRAACSVKNAPGFCTSIWSISSWVTPASRSAGSTLFEISR
jgi:hypothetical protein